jgi:hypothetical protein
MKLNVGNLESFFRIFIGTVVLYAALHAYIGAWGYIGAYILATGLSRFSPLRAVFGLNGFHEDGEAHHS